MADRSSPEELQRARLLREAHRRLSLPERHTYLLKLAQRTAVETGYAAHGLEGLIADSEAALRLLHEQAGGRVYPRRRPAHAKQDAGETDDDPGSPTVSVYLDECGAHSLNSKEKFGVFSLAAVIIRDDRLPDLDQSWRQWKGRYLGSPDALIHEPDLRRGNRSFWCGGDRLKRAGALRALGPQITGMDFTAVACVVHRDDYLRYYSESGVQALPEHLYLMTLTFLMERIVMVLDKQFDGARARIYAESREKREDALLQYEYVRLHLDGTSFIAPTWFRHQLEPNIHFRLKRHNLMGLQLADLLARPCAALRGLARPCAEKVLQPASTPDRWPEFRDKLADGKETEHSILGLKIFPWDDRFVGLWTS